MKTADLTGAALDWAVARALGLRPSLFLLVQSQSHHAYSTDWAQGGPIIERMGEAGLSLRKGSEGTGNQRWWASLDTPNRFYHGHAPLIAAMRCYVASKLGDEVDVPKELL